MKLVTAEQFGEELLEGKQFMHFCMGEQAKVAGFCAIYYWQVSSGIPT